MQFNNKQQVIEIHFVTKFGFSDMSRVNPPPKLINEGSLKKNKPNISSATAHYWQASRVIFEVFFFLCAHLSSQGRSKKNMDKSQSCFCLQNLLLSTLLIWKLLREGVDLPWEAAGFARWCHHVISQTHLAMLQAMHLWLNTISVHWGNTGS